MVRRLAAVMFTDMVGSTRLAQEDEQAVLRLLEAAEALAGPVLSAYHGRLVKSMGDGMLVEFGNAMEAVQCAVELQRQLQERGADGSERPLQVRIGIHTGDVEERGTDILGDAVNVAARVEPLADPGGICLSGVVFENVRNKVPYTFESMGSKTLKGVLQPMEVYRVVLPWQRTDSASAAERDRTRVAVLPFTSMSPDVGDEYFADGMTEELIDRLAQVRELQVIARTSVMVFKKKERKVSEIAKELSVGSVVEGSVRKAGNRVRVAAQLIDAGTEAHVWSSHYDGSLDDIFAIQSAIAEKVAGELKIRLLPSEKRTLGKRPTESVEAYGLFLRGRELLRQQSEPSLRQALTLFESAAALDPTFARAHAAMAECHQVLYTLGLEPRDVMLTIVKPALHRALELDPDLAEVHATLAVLHLDEDDFLRAESEAKKAVELNASLPDPHSVLFEVAGLRGDVGEMVRQVEAAHRLDPIARRFIGLVGWAYFISGQEQKALEHLAKCEVLSPNATYRILTEIHLARGDLGRAREMHEKFQRLEPTNPWVTYMGGILDATAGNRTKALQAIRKIEDAKLGPITYNFVAFVYHALGDMDRYFENMNRAVEEHTLPATDVMYSPLLARSRTDPRYQELLRRLRSLSGMPN